MVRRPLIVGHRGAMGHAPENTLASFDLAARLGADAIEMDVHLSEDGRLVVFHDSDLGRITGVSGPVQAASWRKISVLSAGALFDPRFKKEKVPSLEQVLGRYQSKKSLRGAPLGFVIELKAHASLVRGRQLAQAVSRMITRFGLAPRTFVISFSHAYLPFVKAPVRKGILFYKRIKNPVARARAAGADCLCPRKDLVTAVMMRQARQEGLGVFAWTANSTEDYARLLRRGVDGITTNYPDRLFKTLGK
jgi:glycerophosphoryl diester phosphodiesterase